MGLDIAAREKYLASVKKLFPQGEYWDAQFADPESDVSLFCEAKLDELIRFRGRMSQLQDESRPETTDELIADWERVLLDSVSYGLDLNQRRLLLKSKQDVKLNRAELEKIAEMYGLSIADVSFPFRPFFTGHSRFGGHLGSPAVFSVLLITAAMEGFKAWAWNIIKPEFEAGRFGRIHLGLERMCHFPVYQLRRYVDASLRKSQTGFMRLGIDSLFYLPAKDIVGSEIWPELRRGCLGFMRFFGLPAKDLFQEIWLELRKGCFTFFTFGISRMAAYDNGFSKTVDAVVAESGLIAQMNAIYEGEPLTDFYRMAWYDAGFTKPVNEITAVSEIIPQTDANFTAELLLETQFMARLESAMIKAMIFARRPFTEFELAIRNKLLANQIAYFDYGGQ